jgi:hypothetical protein
MIKRDGSPLNTSVIAIRDGINKALNATLIQRVECNAAKYLMFTTMDTLKVPLLTGRPPSSYTVSLTSPQSTWTHTLHNYLFMAYLHLSAAPILAGHSPHSTLCLYLHNSPDGSPEMRNERGNLPP